MMKKSYILIILISFLVISPKLYAQVECPCQFFESVPMTTACWIEPFVSNPEYLDDPALSEACFVINLNSDPLAFLQMFVGPATEQRPEAICGTQSIGLGGGCTATPAEEVDLTPEQVKACQCELIAYVTALNEVDGIMVSGGPPYECFDVDCRPVILSPIPTLNEWGMITTAGVLGLLAVIGLFVIRRRKAAA